MITTKERRLRVLETCLRTAMLNATIRYNTYKPGDINLVLSGHLYRCMLDAGYKGDISIFFKNLEFVEDNTPNPKTDKLLTIWQEEERKEFEKLFIDLNLSNLTDLPLDNLHFFVTALTDYLFTRIK